MSKPFQIEGKVIGQKEQAQLFLDKESALRARMRETISELGERLRSGAQSAAPHASGKLSDSIKMRLREKANVVSARVSVSSAYGRSVERGVNRIGGHVRSYVRHYKGNDRSGLLKTKSFKTRTRLKWGQTASGIVFVKEYKRSRHITAHPYLMNTLEAMRDDIVNRIIQAASWWRW